MKLLVLHFFIIITQLQFSYEIGIRSRYLHDIPINNVNRTAFNHEVATCYLKNKRKSEILNCPPLVNDPQFMKQWYLVPRPEPIFGNKITVDLGILDVWVKYGLFGQGIVLVIFDDGVEVHHPDLRSSFNPNFYWDYCLPSHQTDSLDSSPPCYHGTMVAGIIAMEINNEIHGVGVAPKINLGTACIFGEIDTKQYPHGSLPGAFEKKIEQIHIIANIYALDRNIKINKLPEINHILRRAYNNAASKGRHGLGTILIFPSSNHKLDGFGCAFNDLAQSLVTIVVAASTPWGSVTDYSARCANIMVTAPSSPHTTDFFPTTVINGDFSLYMTGTSCSASIVAGIIALTLNANPNLTWRDIHHLIVYTSSKQQLDQAVFIKNGAGIDVSHDFGFGLISAIQMVETAFNFKSVPNLQSCEIYIQAINQITSCIYYIKTNACKGKPNEINFLERVALYIDISYNKKWSQLQIFLISPSENEAVLLEKEPANNSNLTTLKWQFYSVITWGESPVGTWLIKICDSEEKQSFSGIAHNLILTFYGTKEKPYHYK